MNTEPNLGSLPGTKFSSAYATICKEVNGEDYYSTVKNPERLKDSLTDSGMEGSVEAVRVNDIDRVPEILEAYEPELAVGKRSEKPRAFVYGRTELVRGSYEEFVEDHELLENLQETSSQEAI